MTKKLTLKVKGIHCQSCVSLIKNSVKNLSGITNVAVDVDSKKAEVIYDGNKTKENEIIEKIKKAGDYTAEPWDETEEIKEDNSAQDKKIASSAQRNNGNTGSGISSGKNFLTAAFLVSVFLNLFFMSNATSRDVLKNSLANLSGSGNTAQNNQGQTAKKNTNAPLFDNQQPQAPAPVSFAVTKDNNIRGDFDAPITLVEFSDFECPFCARHLPTLNRLLNEYDGKVRLVYKHFPLGFHPNAQKAAEASECAGEQGKFWEYHDKLFENYQDYGLDNFKQWAKDLRLNSAKFNDCLDSGKYAQKVKKDAQEGAQKGVNGTPATFVNGQLVSGAVPYEAFKQIIDGLLQ